MKILEMRAIRGANYYSRSPVIFIKLDLEELEKSPTDQIPGFRENLHRILPTMQEHTCSPGYPGGFYERLDQGTWAGHVVEHIAIELQNLIGHKVSFGKTYTMPKAGIYELVYRYLDEGAGLRAGEMAFEITKALFKGNLTEIPPLLEELKEVEAKGRFGPSTQSIVEEARRRGISHYRLNEDSYVQLGQGKYQRRIQATMMDSTSALGVEIADDKERTKELLFTRGIPVPEGRSVRSLEEALETAGSIGYPVVVKPLIGNHGRGVSVNVRNEQELAEAYDIAGRQHCTVLVEKYLQGFDFRVLVIDGQFTAAALREPANVVGNGQDTIESLISKVNEDPDRGEGHEKNLTMIHIDESLQAKLNAQGLHLETVLPEGKKVYVKATANLSTGGTAMDVTDKVHPFNRRMMERVSRIIGLNVIGIDIVADTLELPLEQGFSGIVEVNAAPGFRMHLNPSKGEKRNISEKIVDMLFPGSTKHSIPIIAVTGTNGKTTTAKLIAHVLSSTGRTVGLATTDGVMIDGSNILRGDYSGPEGAHQVMLDSSVDHAVLEVARGGILRRGLGYETCDTGIFLNVSSDHLGEGSIETLEELARLKSTVTESVKPGGYSIMNADDDLVMDWKEKAGGRVILFSMDLENPRLSENLENGSINITVKNGQIILQKKGRTATVASVEEVPLTFEGRAAFNIENILAAVGALVSSGLNEKEIRAGLMSFQANAEFTPGRMNIMEMDGFKAIVDYGHNVGAVRATSQFIQELMPGRKIRMASGVGNRRKEDLLEFGKTIAEYYDHVILCDSDPRERKAGETARIVKRGLLKGGLALDQISLVIDEKEATRIALEMARPGDVVVLQADNIDQVIKDVRAFQTRSAGLLKLGEFEDLSEQGLSK